MDFLALSCEHGAPGEWTRAEGTERSSSMLPSGAGSSSSNQEFERALGTLVHANEICSVISLDC